MSWSHGAGRKGGRRGPLGAGRAPRSGPARLRPAEGDRLQQAAALRRAAGRRVRLAAGPDQKQPGPGSAAPRAVARGPLLDQETLHVSVPGPAGWAGGKGSGVKASAGGGGGGGSLSAPDRWTLNSAPVRADRFCAVIPGSRPKPGKHSSFLPATFLRDLPGSHQPSVSFAAASLQGFGLLSSDIRGPGEREGTGPAGKERSGPPGVLLGPLPVAGGSREDSSLSEQLDFSWC